MAKKKQAPALSPEKKKLVDKIHKWAHLDATKHPKEFEKLFAEIWESRIRGK